MDCDGAFEKFGLAVPDAQMFWARVQFLLSAISAFVFLGNLLAPMDGDVFISPLNRGTVVLCVGAGDCNTFLFLHGVVV